MIITNAEQSKTQIFCPEPPQPVIVQRMGRVTDEPPPYVARQVSTPMPSTQALIPTPPSQIHRSVSTPALQIPSLPPRRSSPVKRDILPTNFLYLHTRKDPIVGKDLLVPSSIYHVDPDLPMVELDKTGTLAISRQDYNKKNKQKHRHHSKKNKRIKNQVPNAIFQSKSGDISLHLAVVAPPLVGSSPALIQAASKKGNIDIKIPFINSLRRLNLEVKTQHVYSKDGKLVFLPHISSAMNIVSRRDRETQVVVGDAVYNTPKQGMDWTGDTIHVASRDGNIYIGYVNEDRKPIEEAGFWKKLVDGMVDMLSIYLSISWHSLNLVSLASESSVMSFREVSVPKGLNLG
ncbi:hypothetical protein Clacol_005218 [Clathrus columnatus]|uniref:DUF7330 domain-containing protein n=1 Tax=Clathrus columnatus TaxID=1419009 RepID=A0AAV5AE49_9AGAM|nr:hypothetical protein Clacol_005218 [Clathrus columnatus]